MTLTQEYDFWIWAQRNWLTIKTKTVSSPHFYNKDCANYSPNGGASKMNYYVMEHYVTSKTVLEESLPSGKNVHIVNQKTGKEIMPRVIPIELVWSPLSWKSITKKMGEKRLGWKYPQGSSWRSLVDDVWVNFIFLHTFCNFQIVITFIVRK